MMGQTARIQAQAVLYHNEIASIAQTVEALANAVRYAREKRGLTVELSLAYGDSGDKPLLSEEDLRLLRERGGDELTLRYQFFGFNAGSAKGQNLLAEPYDGDYVYIMNPDVKPCPDFFHYMLLPFSDERVGAVEARQVPLEHPKVYDPATGETPWCTGACTMLRNAVFREVGGFDSDTFFLYCDDVDLSWRVKHAGYRLIYQPHAMVYHAKEVSAEGDWSPSWAEMFYSAEAAMLMAYKWCDDARLEKLCSHYRHGSEVEREAFRAFRKRRQDGRLPARIQAPDVPTYSGDNYSRTRFSYTKRKSDDDSSGAKADAKSRGK